MIIDFHCDTISALYKNPSKKLSKNDLHIDIEKLTKAKSLAQFFALFIHWDSIPQGLTSTQYCLDMLDKFYLEIEENNQLINIARNYDELMNNSNDGKISAFLTIEEGGVLENNIANLRNFYRLGVRLITLTWNYANCIGYPSSDMKYQDKGLTDFGFEVINEMNHLGMLIDVSHLSDKGFYDVANHSKAPFIASHSNCRILKNHNRNLTDEMIQVIAKKGGVVGVNFYNDFLSDNPISRVDDIIRHINHLKDIGGIDIVALGSDFDGINNNLEIKNISEINKLTDALIKQGFTSSEIDKITHKNAIRIIKDVLKKM